MRCKGEKNPEGIVRRHRPDLSKFETLYRELHQNPELSGNETETANTVCSQLRELGFHVQDSIGGFGVVGVFANGDGPVVMLPSELDALPIAEDTELPYVSHKHMVDRLDGKAKLVMHACGHDMHIACLIGAATLLKSAKNEWSGTLICLFQPSEELLNGAQAMIDDGLFDRIPTPDIILGQHVGKAKAGTLAILDGRILTSADSFDVRIFGRGGHGGSPSKCIDPILIGSHAVVRLQSIMNREIPPGQMGIITCGSFHAGETANIIPDYADLKIDLRTYDPSVRAQALDAIKRVVTAECNASGAEKEPSFTRTRTCPVLINDKFATETVRNGFEQHFAHDLGIGTQGGASDDFAVYSIVSGILSVYWSFGSTDAEKWDDAVEKGCVDLIPGNHSPRFSLVIQPTMRIGVDALAIAALQFFEI